MALISAMPLPVLPVEDPDFQRDPMPYVEAAREQHPWLARWHLGYVVTDYQATRDIYLTTILKSTRQGLRQETQDQQVDYTTTPLRRAYGPNAPIFPLPPSEGQPKRPEK